LAGSPVPASVDSNAIIASEAKQASGAAITEGALPWVALLRSR